MKTRALVLFLCFTACGVDEAYVGEEEPALDDDKARIASAVATAMDFTFSASLWVPGSVSAGGARSYIDEQLLFTIGHLNGSNAVGRLDKVTLTNVRATAEGAGTLVSYTVKLPVSWGSKTSLPTTYDFVLPRDASWSGVEAFATKYQSSCVDGGAHDVDSGSIWYYYRPRASGCALADADVVKVKATAAVSPENTTGKYPEFHKVWEDGVLNVVAIFGKYEDGATASSDSGIAAYASFVRAMRTELGANGLVTTPATLPATVGVETPDITFEAQLSPTRKVRVVALLVDNVRTAGAAFDARYTELSTRADLIAYNGHAGLGANVRALSQKGRFVAGQYAIFFMNGCDTYAYVDGSLAQARARLNPDDPTGTRYMEIVTNGMPAFFNSMPGASLALIRGLKNPDAPLTYEQMFKNVDRAQVVLVTGEEDNVFVPAGPPPPAPWAGMVQQGNLSRAQEARFTTPTLPAGKYVFALTGTGDADLYVRGGVAPTTAAYDCRPYANGSAEQCVLNLSASSQVHVMVRGYAASSTFKLEGKRQP